MKRLIAIVILIIGGIHLFAQSPNREYVPIDLKWADHSKLIQPSEPLKIAPYTNSNSRRSSNMGQTFTFTKAEIVDKNDKSCTSYKFESTVTIKDDVVDVFLKDEYFQTRIVTSYWKEGTLILKTLSSDNAAVTYQKLPGDKEFIIEFPETMIILGK